MVAMAAGVAANEGGWVSEAATAFAATERHGRQSDGEREALKAAAAMMEGRWEAARLSYMAARHDLNEAQSLFALALLSLSVGARAEGRFPEAVEAAAAANEFFESVGAQAFLERYRERFVPSLDGGTVTAGLTVGSPTRETTTATS